jgi:hypothetical protein
LLSSSAFFSLLFIRLHNAASWGAAYFCIKNRFNHSLSLIFFGATYQFHSTRKWLIRVGQGPLSVSAFDNKIFECPEKRRTRRRSNATCLRSRIMQEKRFIATEARTHVNIIRIGSKEYYRTFLELEERSSRISIRFVLDKRLLFT